MSKNHIKSLKDVMELFEDSLSQADIVSATIQSKICTAILNERISRGLNQKEFAELLDVSQGMVSRWESSDYNFTINTIAKIAEKLDLLFDVTLAPEHSKTTRNVYNRTTSKVISFPHNNSFHYIVDQLEVM